MGPQWKILETDFRRKNSLQHNMILYNIFQYLLSLFGHNNLNYKKINGMIISCHSLVQLKKEFVDLKE